jgi:hypothetical protein
VKGLFVCKGDKTLLHHIMALQFRHAAVQ